MSLRNQIEIMLEMLKSCDSVPHCRCLGTGRRGGYNPDKNEGTSVRNDRGQERECVCPAHLLVSAALLCV